MSTNIASKANQTADRYFGLVRAFPLRPIRSDGDLDLAIKMIDGLIDQDGRAGLDDGERDYLDVLGGLVHQYEQNTHPILPSPPEDVLRHLIEGRDITPAQLAEETGIADSTISGILSGEQGMTREHAETFARFFGVGPGAFLR